jgi:hypothetical protein
MLKLSRVLRSTSRIAAGICAMLAPLLLLQPADAAPAICPSGQIRIGFTLTHIRVSPDETACETDKVASLSAADNIVLHMQDPTMRAQVDADLRQMASQGATVIRTIVWYRTDSGGQAGGRNPLGTLDASDGTLPQQVLSNLSAYIGDAARAGYKRFVIVSGAQGAGNPKCHKITWGDCFDANLMPADWSVTRQLILAGRAAEKNGISVIVDIASESCFLPQPRLAVGANLRRYDAYMLGQYASQFHDSKFIMSCGAGKGRIRGVLAELENEVHLFQQMNVRPAELDIHIYRNDPAQIGQLLLAAQSDATQLGVPFSVNETAYDKQALFSTVATLASQGELPSLRDVLIWPKHTGSPCAVDVSAPYDFSAEKAVLGNLVRRDSAAVCPAE